MKDGAIIEVRIQPGARRTEVAGMFDDMVRIRVAARPVEGAANKELVKFLARKLGVSKSRIEILSGHKSRVKRLGINGLEASAVISSLLA